MIVNTVKESGFCHGVQKAIDRANGLAKYTQDREIFLYGDLINNRHVIEDFKRRGFLVETEVDAISPNSIVIVRAHGIPRAVYDKLNDKNVTIEDCTCYKVKNIHKIVQEKSLEGYQIIIVGKSDHPEVIGTYGWCEEGSAIVIEKEADLKDIDWKKPLCIVGQTTCKRGFWNKIVGLVQTKKPEAEVHDTMCSVIDLRMEKAREISACSNAIVVVGDENSSNSLELRDACAEICPNTFFVSSLEDLLDTDSAKKILDSYAMIGLVGSASAPREIIEDIYSYLLFSNFLAQAKGEIEKASNQYFAERMIVARDKPFIVSVLESLNGQNQGGKRIRGALIKLGEQIASNGKSSQYLPIAMGYELFQTAILIHDDIVDKSPIRRGKATIHVATANDKKQRGMESSLAEHFGMANAICIGDYGYFLTNEILLESDIESKLLIDIFKFFAQIQTITCEGEIMDVTLPYESISIATDYDAYIDVVERIYEYKTAWYTLVGPIVLGAICGGASAKLIDQLRNITMPLGIAFQIKDDLLGIYASEKTLGKATLSDLVEKKQTLLYGYAYRHATPQQRIVLDASYGNTEANLGDLETIRGLFVETGAREYAESEIIRLSQISINFIDTAAISDVYKALLKGLVNFLITRRF